MLEIGLKPFGQFLFPPQLQDIQRQNNSPQSNSNFLTGTIYTNQTFIFLLMLVRFSLICFFFFKGGEIPFSSEVATYINRKASNCKTK